MKKLIGFVVVLALSFIASTAKVAAREGSFQISNADVSCEGMSLWDESAYRISGKCDGMVYPYSTEMDHYVAWVKLDNGNITRLGDIERGFFSGNVSDSFSSIFVTAESTSSPRKPATEQYLSGGITPLTFDTSSTTVAPTPAPTATTTGATVNTNSAAAGTTSTAGSVIGKILKSLLIIVGVIIVLVIGASLIFRQRGSVSS